MLNSPTRFFVHSNLRQSPKCTLFPYTTLFRSRALLGGVALTVLSAGAQADELNDLKAQLEALQAQVNQLENRPASRSEEHTSELQSREKLVCRLLLEKKNKKD